MGDQQREIASLRGELAELHVDYEECIQISSEVEKGLVEELAAVKEEATRESEAALKVEEELPTEVEGLQEELAEAQELERQLNEGMSDLTDQLCDEDSKMKELEARVLELEADLLAKTSAVPAAAPPAPATATPASAPPAPAAPAPASPAPASPAPAATPAPASLAPAATPAPATPAPASATPAPATPAPAAATPAPAAASPAPAAASPAPAAATTPAPAAPAPAPCAATSLVISTPADATAGCGGFAAIRASPDATAVTSPGASAAASPVEEEIRRKAEKFAREGYRLVAVGKVKDLQVQMSMNEGEEEQAAAEETAAKAQEARSKMDAPSAESTFAECAAMDEADAANQEDIDRYRVVRALLEEAWIAASDDARYATFVATEATEKRTEVARMRGVLEDELDRAKAEADGRAMRPERLRCDGYRPSLKRIREKRKGSDTSGAGKPTRA